VFSALYTWLLQLVQSTAELKRVPVAFSFYIILCAWGCLRSGTTSVVDRFERSWSSG